MLRPLPELATPGARLEGIQSQALTPMKIRRMATIPKVKIMAKE